MPDETPQPNPEPVESEPTPTHLETLISEPTPQPPAPSEPVEQAPIQTDQSNSAEATPDEVESSPSPEDATPVNNGISANEPLEPTPIPQAPNEPNNPNITIKKNGNDVTITEVMDQPKTETAHLVANEPLDLAEELKIKQREENLKLANETRQEKKRKKIGAILDLFAKQTNLTNDEVEKLLHVSDATATRYLDELEKEGKIKQVGKTGKHTHYEKI